MQKFLLILFATVSYQICAQTDVVELGILPTEYGEGMSPDDFLDIEEHIINRLKSIPRYRIVKEQEDYYDTSWGDDWYAQMEAIRTQGQQDNVPYLLQIIFGDTEWSSELVPIYPQKTTTVASSTKEDDKSKNEVKAPSKEKEDSTKAKSTEKNKDSTSSQKQAPAKVPKVWNHNASIWLTLNLYKVETGEMIKSETYHGKSFDESSMRTTEAIKQRKEFKNALQAAKSSLYPSVLSDLKTLVPFQIEVLEPLEKTSKAIKTIKVKAGTYHGLKERDRLYIYYETVHNVNGKDVVREIFVSSLMIESLDRHTAVCKVKKGSKALLQLLGKKDLKCKYQEFYFMFEGFGF